MNYVTPSSLLMARNGAIDLVGATALMIYDADVFNTILSVTSTKERLGK
jgi:hypothetical protein